MAWFPAVAKGVATVAAKKKGVDGLLPASWQGGAQIPQSANTSQGLQTPQQIVGLNTSANQMNPDPYQLPSNQFAEQWWQKKF